MNKYFIDVIKNHYADFKGTATRKQYWMFILWNIIVSLLIVLIFAVVPSVKKVVSTIYVLALLVPVLALFVRRVRDTGQSPYWGLLQAPSIMASIIGCLPQSVLESSQIVVGAVFLLVLLCFVPILIFALLPSKK